MTDDKKPKGFDEAERAADMFLNFLKLQDEYAALAKENEELKANYNGLDLEFDQFRARCPIPNMDVINDNIKLRQEITSLRESLEKLEKEIETAIDSLLFYAQGRDPVIRRLTDNGEGQLSAWQCARALLDKIKAKGGL